MATDLVVYDSLLGSMSPRSSEKSVIGRWYDDMRTAEMVSRQPSFGGVVTTGLQAIRQAGEAGITGGLLAAAHALLPNGLDIGGKVPADAVVGALGVAGSVALSGTELSRDALNIGAVGIGVFSFRKFGELLGEKQLVKGGALPGGSARIHGEGNDDPIVAAARTL